MGFAKDLSSDQASLHRVRSPLHSREALEDAPRPASIALCEHEDVLQLTENNFDAIGTFIDWPHAHDDARLGTPEIRPQIPWTDPRSIDLSDSSSASRSFSINRFDCGSLRVDAGGLPSSAKRSLPDLDVYTRPRKQARLARDSPLRACSTGTNNDIFDELLGLSHCRVSSNNQNHHCSCGKAYTKRYRLNEHIKSATGQRYPCSFNGCSETFTRKDIRVRHEQNIHQDKKATCPGCLQAFRTDYLRDHLKGDRCRQTIAQALRHDLGSESDAFAGSLRPPFAHIEEGRNESIPILARGAIKTNCDLCRRPFEDGDDELVGHLNLHSMELLQRPYHCADCDISFAFIGDLKAHQRTATNGRCGFVSDAEHKCNGHHPPDVEESETANDFTHQRFQDRLMAWETCQLRSHRATVVRLLAYRLVKGNAVRYSLDNLNLPYATMFARFSQISINSCNSLPSWWKAKDDVDVDQLALSMQDLLGMSSKSSDSSTRGLRRKAAGVAGRWFQSGEIQHQPVHVAA